MQVKTLARKGSRKSWVWGFVSTLSPTGKDMVAFCIIYSDSEVRSQEVRNMLIWKYERQARNEYPTAASTSYPETANNSNSKPGDCKYNGSLKSSWFSIQYSYIVSRNTIFTSDWYPRNKICLTPNYLFIHESPAALPGERADALWNGMVMYVCLVLSVKLWPSIKNSLGVASSLNYMAKAMAYLC